MTNRPEAVTAEDVRGLRVETGRIADQLETMATKEEVASKADTVDVNEVRRLAGRANINSTIAVIAVVISVVAVLSVVYFVVHQHNEDQAKTHDRRVADCQAVADFGDLVKQGITVISAPPERQAQLDVFTQQYDAAIDAGVTKVRAQKGYSADCTVIGNPPKAGG